MRYVGYGSFGQATVMTGNDLDGDQVISFSNNDGDKIILSKSFCTKNRLNAVDILSVFKIKGDAMQETLFNDDLVLVDTSDKYFISGLIYLIYFYGEKMAVRLHRSANGLIEITKDNPFALEYKEVNY